MRRSAALLFPALLLCTSLAGCATGGEYPSLARRPAERAIGSGMPVAARPVESVVPAVQTAGLAGRLNGLVAQARAVHRRFTARAPAAARLAAASRGVGSEGWGVAQVALADLDSLRSEAMIVLADLDSLYVSAAVEDRAADVTAIVPARETVTAIVAEEDAALARMRR